MSERQLLVISAHAAEFSKLLAQAELPDLAVTAVTSPEQALPHCAGAQLLFGAPDMIVPILPQCSKLQWVQSSWAGITPFIDHPRRDYLLTGVKGIFGQVMAEYVLAWLLHIERDIPRHLGAQNWDERPDGSLRGRQIGIMGAGSIGQAVAGYLRPFNMTIRGLNSDGSVRPGFDHCFGDQQRFEFASELDYLLAILPDTPATDGIVNKALIDQLKPGATLINVGRGNSVVMSDVTEALDSGQLGGAVIDVLEQEPLPDTDPLWQVPGLVITSHTAAPSLTPAIVSVFCDNYRRFHAGEELHYLIDFDRGY